MFVFNNKKCSVAFIPQVIYTGWTTAAAGEASAYFYE
jgi:hypothetical protein